MFILVGLPTEAQRVCMRNSQPAHFVLRMATYAARRLERASGIEPPSPAWKAGVIATIRRPHRAEAYY